MEDLKRDLNLTWEAQIFKDNVLTVQIKFSKPEDISREVSLYII